MNNMAKMFLPATALCIYSSGCIAYEQPVYHRTPTYVTPATTYVTEPVYVEPVPYSTTTYVAEPVYIDNGYRHHSAGHTPLHGKYGSGPRHSPHGSHVGMPAPQKAAVHSAQSAQKAAVHGAKSAQKVAAHSAMSTQKTAMHTAKSTQNTAAHSAKSTQKAAAKAMMRHR